MVFLLFQKFYIKLCFIYSLHYAHCIVNFFFSCLSNSIHIVRLFKILNMYTIKFAKFNLIHKINPSRKR